MKKSNFFHLMRALKGRWIGHQRSRVRILEDSGCFLLSVLSAIYHRKDPSGLSNLADLSKIVTQLGVKGIQHSQNTMFIEGEEMFAKIYLIFWTCLISASLRKMTNHAMCSTQRQRNQLYRKLHSYLTVSLFKMGKLGQLTVCTNQVQ